MYYYSYTTHTRRHLVTLVFPVLVKRMLNRLNISDNIPHCELWLSCEDPGNSVAFL